METVTISPKYQVVIPRRIREALALEVGQKIRVLQYEGRIEYVPILEPGDARGFLRGIETDVDREPDRT